MLPLAVGRLISKTHTLEIFTKFAQGLCCQPALSLLVPTPTGIPIKGMDAPIGESTAKGW